MALLGVLGDLRHAYRRIWRNPGLPSISFLVLALGLGANIASFSIISAALLRSLPYPRTDELVSLFERDVVGEQPFNQVSPRNFSDWQQQATGFQQIAAFSALSFNLSDTEASKPEWVDGIACTENLLSLLDVKLLLGRRFSALDDQPGASRSVLLGQALWQSRFGGDMLIVGRQIRLDKEKFTVIGVFPSDLGYPSPTAQIWIALRRHYTPKDLESRGNHYLAVVGRLKENVTPQWARTELDSIARRIKQLNPNVLTGKGANVVPLRDSIVRRSRTSMLILLGVSNCVLLIACFNVGNLVLTQAIARRQEVAIRMALGAQYWDLVQHFVCESLVLVGGGLLLALPMGFGGARFAASRLPDLAHLRIELDVRVMLFACSMAIVTAILVGIVPSIQLRGNGFSTAAKEGDRTAAGGRSHVRFRSALTTAEVAISVILLIATGLLLRSFTQLHAVSPGFVPDRVLSIGIALPPAEYAKVRAYTFFHDVLDHVRGLPGVISAGIVSNLPLKGHRSDSSFTIDGHPPLPPGQFLNAANLWVDPGYFQAIGIPLTHGRFFTRVDEQLRPDGAVIISRTMAEQFFPGEDPLGRYLRLDAAGPRYEVVGIVGDVNAKLDTKPEATMYFPLMVGAPRRESIVIRTKENPMQIVAAVRHEINDLDGDLALTEITTMSDLLDKSTLNQRFNVELLGTFSVLALVVAAVGLYGVVSQLVKQRSKEVAIRLALGAGRADVFRMVVFQGMQTVLIGMVIGLIGSLALTRFLVSLLFATSPNDPLTFATVCFALLLVTLIACAVPAIRATSIDPAIELRNN